MIVMHMLGWKMLPGAKPDCGSLKWRIKQRPYSLALRVL